MSSALSPHSLCLGIDFGTTNTVVALADASGPAHLVKFPAPEGELFAFRSCLSFHAGDQPNARAIAAGPWAIDAYVEDPAETRFIQSFKSFAASESFSETTILNRRYRFEDLLSTFLLKLRAYADAGMAELPSRVIVGRPVTFAGGAPSEPLALSRYETAFARMGFTEILYAYEPVGAAFFFARELDHDATVLVGDFGGGTSDFSIIRFERHAGEIRAIPLGRSGVGVAGDAFDYRIIDNLVSPALGKGSSYQSFGKVLPIPNRYYSAFARWDQLALMRASRDMREIRALVREAMEPEKIERLVETLDENYGYQLYRSVSRLKEALSSEEAAEFRVEFSHDGRERLVEPVPRIEIAAVERPRRRVRERRHRLFVGKRHIWNVFVRFLLVPGFLTVCRLLVLFVDAVISQIVVYDIPAFLVIVEFFIGREPVLYHSFCLLTGAIRV